MLPAGGPVEPVQQVPGVHVKVVELDTVQRHHRDPLQVPDKEGLIGFDVNGFDLQVRALKSPEFFQRQITEVAAGPGVHGYEVAQAEGLDVVYGSIPAASP